MGEIHHRGVGMSRRFIGIEAVQGLSIRTIVALVLLLLVLIFALQNTEAIDLHFLQWDFSLKIGYAVGVPFLLGILVGLLLSWRHHRRIQKTQLLPEPGSPAALLANASTGGVKRKGSWWW
jgi:uncharacterized integral membrane protein